uniref:Ty3-gypsy retrotransposon protein n=1 Tax=Rhabditophanes sp. KR3021 TaxID=114890 RepID=A0AC35UCQ0_9BILA
MDMEEMISRLKSQNEINSPSIQHSKSQVGIESQLVKMLNFTEVDKMPGSDIMTKLDKKPKSTQIRKDTGVERKAET